jgi:inner membrane protein
MASVFSHAAVALAIGRISTSRSMPPRFWWLSILCSILPDADVLSFVFGIDYGSLLGHRGLTHSLSFAVILGIVVVRIWFQDEQTWSRIWWMLIAHFSFVTASHGMLDAMTDGGLGVAFFAPFDNARYFFPWRPILVSPIGIAQFFSGYGLDVLLNEFLWIWIPAGGMLIMVNVWQRFLGCDLLKKLKG